MYINYCKYSTERRALCYNCSM